MCVLGLSIMCSPSACNGLQRSPAGARMKYKTAGVFFDMLKSFLTDESGATMIEYGLIAALVSVAAIAALTLLGTSLTNIFTNVSNILNNV